MTSSLSLLSSLFLLAIPVLADPSPGCSANIPRPLEWSPVPGEVKIFRVNDRHVRVTVPSAYNETKPAPMILAFHDKEQPVEHLEFDGGWDEPAINPDIIMVYPTASEDNDGRWLSDISPRKKAEPGVKRRRANNTADLEFTHSLVKDMENLMCIDTARIYALGVGTGGGMAHLLACNQYLSQLFAAYGAVAGIFGRGKEGKQPWGVCDPSREVIPVIEVHGTDDRVAPYFLGEGENGKKRVIPGHWVEEWAERNGCGSFVDEEKWIENEDEGRKTWVGRYDDGGAISETVGHGGAAIRVARRCPGVPRKLKIIKQEIEVENGEKKVVEEKVEEEETPKERENIRLPNEAIPDEMTSVLHYQLKSYGHGWPRQQLSRQKEVVFHGEQITIPYSKKTANDTFFDTTKVILSFFKTHILEEKFAKRTTVASGADGGPLSEEEMAKQVKAQYGLEHAVLGKVNSGEKPSPDAIEEKLKEFQAAQERIKQASGGAKEGSDTSEEPHDEL